jgi:transposase
MFVDFSRVSLFIRPGSTDMRKAANGLSILVQEQIEKDPFSCNLFLFCNKRKNILKILYWDRNGFCTWLLCKALHNNHIAKPFLSQ